MTLVKREVTGLGIGSGPDQVSEIEGVLLKVTEDVGENHSMMYTLILENGQPQNVWGSTTMDQRIGQTDIGNFCLIKFEGMEKNPKSGRTFKDIQVYWEAEPVDQRVSNWPGYKGAEVSFEDDDDGEVPFG